jgi:myo-inositol 2-dehydrogenase / D-chiro-inositol 1-dehydrogenase
MQSDQSLNRRAFLGAAAFTIMNASLVRGTQANSAVRVGLLGCGGRGIADASSLLTNAGAYVVGLGDLFDDQLLKAKGHFNGLAAKAGHAGVDDRLIFRGPQACREMAASQGLDAIVIATPPYFHPEHLETVIDGRKHVYCEKPVAVDVPGTRRVRAAAEKAAGKLSLEVGFQIRNAPPFVELVRRIHNGDLGEIALGAAYYYCNYIDAPHPDALPNVYRLRNWIHDKVLSGDIIVEQNIHAIDICNWVLKGHPVKATGTGSGKGRPDNCLSNTSVSFTYPGGVHVAFNSTQFGKGGFDVSERFFGTQGSSSSPYSGELSISGEHPWKWAAAAKQEGAGFSAAGTFSDNLADADGEKHKSFIQSITSGQFHSQGEVGIESSLSAMLGRTAIYSGREVTWDELLRSKEVWDAHLDFSKLS